MSNIQINIGLSNYQSIYKCKVLQPKNGTLLTQDMILEPNTKYIINHILNLNRQTIKIPENCIIEINGGQLKNGTLVGNNTILLNPNGVDSIFNNITQNGTWQYKEGTLIPGPQGPPGRSFTYEDLTDSQKKELIEKALENIHITYPDIKITPSEIQTTFEGKPIYYLLLPAIDTSKILGNYFDVQEEYFDTSKLPQNSVILEAYVFNDLHTESAQCLNNNGIWSIYGSNSDFSPFYALVKYYLK